MLPSVINVSATNRNDKKAAYSNYGQGYITVAAPGGEKLSKDDMEKYRWNICYLMGMNEKYFGSSGTSFAAPKVSAEAALILCKYGNLTPYEVKKRICDTADKAGDEGDFGAGIINVYNALK